MAIKKRRYGRFSPVKNTVTDPPEVTRSNTLRCNRVTSCFSITGPRLCDDALTVIARIVKQFLIFRSCIPMVPMEIMVAMCNGGSTRWYEPW
jgi:hypothetical protein